ncbi:hypothetical protein [Phocaeicola coprocola]|jgi:hypothetical protein|uniref:hypothetical protein n=1 Tax=Phocaeicola coprocola TaxID=310298 RepID=UPI0020502671|nr:hypothetical protein [Phocaeicola coprocola]DAH25544.1 MAG TPA: Protein of unknown function (DUF2847) [Caudoviricetes sp.]DAM66497.1 MAG TPA: Protein of unknown function (DUF2847) [Caudoviricetes sp.]DAQ71604.1 MAG TPA: Protein of unknown function (DUF2847) [Caudoviricetes sp.]
MIEVKDILNKAIGLGACSQSSKATDWKSLVWLFFSPQGCEFCKSINYPSLEMFRSMKGNVESFGVHIEENVKAVNEDKAIIGGTAELTFQGTDKAYKVIIMHSGNVRIKISNYAVVRIENISGNYEIINDGTGKVLI